MNVVFSLQFQARHIYICDMHKNVIQSLRSKRKRKDSGEDGDSGETDSEHPEVDLYQLQVGWGPGRMHALPFWRRFHQGFLLSKIHFRSTL